MHKLLKVALGAAMFTSSVAVSAASFVVLGEPGANLDAAVASAGGTVKQRLTAINAVVAEGGPRFKAAVAAQPGIQEVAPSIKVEWQPPVTANGKRLVEAFELPSTQPGKKGGKAGSDALDPPTNPAGTIDTRFNLQWGHTAVKAVAAWDKGYRGQGARVAVLDGGFQLSHPDIAGRFDPSCTKDMTGEGIEYAPNVDDATGVFAHGMHTAGTVGAAENGIGTIGVAPASTLCLVKVLFNHGSGTFEDVAEGIIFAANNNVDVISMSLGAALKKSGDRNAEEPYTATDAVALRNLVDRAVSYAYQRGSLVITSAGNEAIDGDKDADLIHTPSDSPQAISISATGPRGWGKNPNTFLDHLAFYSNYGRSVINLAAPGGEVDFGLLESGESCTVAGVTRPCYVFDFVFSTGALNSYYWSVGTSMATPHVSGVAALIVSKYGKMHPSQLRAYLNAGADDLGESGNDPAYGAGRVNALGSVSQ
jgi:subtilisin family serine protease